MLTSDSGNSVTPIRSPEAMGRIIRRARTRAGMTQAEFATHLRVTRQAIVSLEQGESTKAVRLMFEAFALLKMELMARPREQKWN